MNTQSNITKSELLAVLQQWQQQKISSDQLQVWMINRYDPTEVNIGPNEPEHIQEAMNIIMNEYELADPSTILREKCALAIMFLNCETDTFLSLRSDFIRNAFSD